MVHEVSAKPRKKSDEELKWQAEDDLRTLRRACEVMNDSGRLARVKKMMKSETQALKKLELLKGLRKTNY